jgi:hypothetical protein
MLLPVTTMYCYEQQQQSYDEGDVEELRERLSFVEY